MGIPYFGGNFAANVEHLEGLLGRKKEEVVGGFILTQLAGDQAGRQMFVGSGEGKYSTAAFLLWWYEQLHEVICGGNRGIPKSFFAELWDHEPGTGKHPSIDFIRDGAVSIETVEMYIDRMFEARASLNPTNVTQAQEQAVGWVIDMLDQGKLRVAEKRLCEVPCDLPGAAPEVKTDWFTHQWIKKAVVLSFCLRYNHLIDGGFTRYFDKVPSKFAGYTVDEFVKGGFRVVPPATARRGAYIAKNVILMPSYVNIGGYVDEGTMVDTWATVGSCAQIGKNVHLSGGVGIGGVLEPIQANPTIIEDNCFIGARSEIVEGVIVEEGSVISMGVFIGQSTKIYNRETGEVTYGRIPAGSVVVGGSLPSKDGKYSLYCAVIVKKVDAKTLSKTELNALLRGDF